MKRKMNFAQLSRTALLLGLIFCVGLTAARAQTPAFTYQGRFTDSTAPQPTNGNYNMQFALFDAASAPVGSAIIVPSVSVVNGIFTVNLDFGAPAFPANMERLLEIRVFNPTTSAYVILSPRQPLTSAPYAIRALNAGTADTATNATQLGGAAATSYLQTNGNGSGLTNLSAANLTGVVPIASGGTGSATQSFVDLTTAQTVAGDKTFSSAVNTSTQYNIGGVRVLSIAGTNNLFAGTNAGTGVSNTGTNNSFVGTSAGQANTTGAGNSFVGSFAGRFNTTGSTNSFVGTSAGFSNTTGNSNSFVGQNAGQSNMTGFNNSFFGRNAGFSNTTGGSNTVIGNSADLNAGNLNFASAIGANAIATADDTIVIGKVAGNYLVNNVNTVRTADTVQIPGNLAVTGTLTSSGANLTNLNASNITSGTLDNARLGIVPIANGGTGGATQNFVDLTNAQTVAGAKTFSSAITGSLNGNASTATNVTGVVAIANGGTGSTTQNFVDLSTMQTVAGAKTFSSAITGNLTGNASTATTAGNVTGVVAIANGGTNSATRNFVDLTSTETVGGTKTFSSTVAAPTFNATTQYNIGGSRVLSVAGNNNLFAGLNAGNTNAANTGTSNSFVGRSAGISNTTGESNTIIGNLANVSGSNRIFASAIGANAIATEDDTIVIGKVAGNYTVNGVVTARTADTVQIPGNLDVVGSITGATKSFKIDYPLDPQNKTLTYTSIESPDIKNIYDGNVTTDADGNATVVLPDYFQALNKDYRYQLTVIGVFAQAIVSDEIKGNQFKIRTDKPGVKVSWQVTGIRRDKFAEDNRAPNVQDKPEAERGTCLYAPACVIEPADDAPPKQ